MGTGIASAQARQYLADTLPARQWRQTSLALGHDHAYVQRYIRTGVPRWLGERDRQALCRLWPMLEEERLKPPALAIRRKEPRLDRRGKAQIDLAMLCDLAEAPRFRELVRLWLGLHSESDRDIAVEMLRLLVNKRPVRSGDAIAA